ncbi:MAG TPA: hypothetical protein VGE93_04705, partial [Bryobacteraceae bacterium]
ACSALALEPHPATRIAQPARAISGVGYRTSTVLSLCPLHAHVPPEDQPQQGLQKLLATTATADLVAPHSSAD